MPVDPALLKVIAGGAGKNPGASPPAMQPGAESGDPAGAPMMTPQPAEGEQMSAMIQITMAMDMLTKSLPPFGAESDEGKAIMKAVESLSKAFGEQEHKARELVPAELRMLMQTLGQQSPEQQAMAGGGPAGAPQMPKAA